MSQLPHTVTARTSQFAWWLSGGHYRSALESRPTSPKTVVCVVHLCFFRILSRYQAPVVKLRGMEPYCSFQVEFISHPWMSDSGIYHNG